MDHGGKAHATLVYPLVLKNSTLDPAMTLDPQMIELLQNVAEGLVAYDETSSCPCSQNAGT